MRAAEFWRGGSAKRADARRARVHSPRGLGTPAFDIQRRRWELLALTYLLGVLAVGAAWLVDPRVVGSRVGLGVVLGVAFTAAAAMHLMRARLPSWTGDVAIPGSLLLIDFGMFFTKLHGYPLLLSPYYVWVGFASPLWFSRRRAALYVLLAVVASGVVVAVAGTTAALAGWMVTMATLVVAFLITNFLTEALVQRERLAVVGEMASVVGHDLRNPLGAMSNTLFLLRHDLGEHLTPEQDRYLTTAEREIGKATNIIGHLTSFVRHSAPVVEPIDVEALVSEVLEVAPPPSGVEISLELEPVRLTADRAQLAEALTNLVTNAYDAMGAQGTLTFGAHTEKTWVCLAVADDAPGIDRAVADRVFEPFFTTKHRGTGLGLAIVRKLTEAHGGTVQVESAPGTGSRFILRLPVTPGVTEATEGGTGSERSPERGAKVSETAEDRRATAGLARSRDGESPMEPAQGTSRQ